METAIVIGILLMILGGAVYYVVRSKKRGCRCVGCSCSGSCAGNCSGGK